MLNLTLVNKENQFQGLFDNPTDLRFFEYDFHGQKKVRELLYRDETRRLTLNRKALSKKKMAICENFGHRQLQPPLQIPYNGKFF